MLILLFDVFVNPLIQVINVITISGSSFPKHPNDENEIPTSTSATTTTGLPICIRSCPDLCFNHVPGTLVSEGCCIDIHYCICGPDVFSYCQDKDSVFCPKAQRCVPKDQCSELCCSVTSTTAATTTMSSTSSTSECKSKSSTIAETTSWITTKSPSTASYNPVTIGSFK